MKMIEVRKDIVTLMASMRSEIGWKFLMKDVAVVE